MVIRPLSLALVSAMLAACAVGPEYRSPQPASTVLPSAGTPGLEASAPTAAWWSQFDDPVLARLVDEALIANPDLRIGIARVEQARAVFSGQRLGQWPHVTFEAADTRAKQPLAEAGGERMLAETASVGFDASWELDLFGRKRRATEAARAELQSEQASLADVQVSLAAEVARHYFELRGSQRRIAIARQTLANLRDTQRLTETRWQLGAGSEQDVQGSRARLLAIEAGIPVLEIDEARSRRRLEVLLGRNPGALDATLAPRAAPAYAKALPVGDVGELLRRRPDIRAAERQLAAATARVGIATADLFPRISLRGFVGFLAGDFGDLVAGDHKAWSVTPSLSWSALDLGSVRARLRAAKAQEEGIAIQYEKTVLSALEETENALDAYGKRQRQLQYTQAQAQAARRAAQLAELRYREGAEDFLGLLDAQRSQLAADDALASAEASVNASVVVVYKALGGWSGTRAEVPAVAYLDAGGR